MRSVKTNTPAKSVAAQAAALAVGTSAKVNKAGSVVPMGGSGLAAGKALADDIWNASQNEGSKWAGYFGRILALDGDGVDAFRSDLNKKKTALAAAEKGVEGGPKTNFVRISEAMTVSKARKNGLTMDNVVEGWNEKGIGEPRTAAQMPHAWIVAFARKFVNQKIGKAPNKRTILTPEQLLQRYILTHFAEPAETDGGVRKALASVAKIANDLKTKMQKRADVEAFLHPVKEEAKTQAKTDKERVAKAIAAGPTPAPLVAAKKAPAPSRTHTA